MHSIEIESKTPAAEVRAVIYSSRVSVDTRVNRNPHLDILEPRFTLRDAQSSGPRKQ